jgi:hypothetical protein
MGGGESTHPDAVYAIGAAGELEVTFEGRKIVYGHTAWLSVYEVGEPRRSWKLGTPRWLPVP